MWEERGPVGQQKGTHEVKEICLVIVINLDHETQYGQPPWILIDN